MDVEEFEIPVPWGHIAVKAWGDKNNPIILAFHGVMDNAGTFDRLIPFLPTNFYYVCVDHLGHGRSSHMPPFFPYHSLNNIIVYKLIMQYFKQEKYIIMGHSYGGQLGMLFAQLYPELVDKLILLDCVYLIPKSVRMFKNDMVNKLEFCLSLHEKMKTRQPPTYTYEQAVQKIQDERMSGFLSKEGAEALIKRGIKPASDGKFTFTVDQRLKHFVNPIQDLRYIIAVNKKFPVMCPILFVLGDGSEPQAIYFKPLLNLLKKRKGVKIVVVPGSHDVHNNEPEVVAPYIRRFLVGREKQKAKL